MSFAIKSWAHRPAGYEKAAVLDKSENKLVIIQNFSPSFMTYFCLENIKKKKSSVMYMVTELPYLQPVQPYKDKKKNETKVLI